MARLILEDGTEFHGFSFGSDSSSSGEVVFNTGMTGYPESFTDPSYSGQILVATYPLIGNYGVPAPVKNKYGLLENFESDKIHINGLIVSDYSHHYSHWSAEKSLSQWLKENNVPALYGIDTRALTKKLRQKGVMLGKIVIGKDVEMDHPHKRNLVAEVSVKAPRIYGDGKKIVLVDCGTKNNIINSLLERGCQVIRVPWNYDFTKEEYDGLVISNGPGDPKMADTTIRNVRRALGGKPIFGICLGNQIVALAAGGDTYKLKYGHRSQNQPCIGPEGRCYITSQNHGYAVKIDKDGWEEWFVNANDGTNEGLINKKLKVMTVQFHPESEPGPLDTMFLFDEFLGGL